MTVRGSRLGVKDVSVMVISISNTRDFAVCTTRLVDYIVLRSNICKYFPGLKD